MRSGNIYCANDKSLSDAINQSKVTKSDIGDLFYSRGILVSKETKRDVLANYFSMFVHDYYDYEKLALILDTSNRREKSTVSYVSASDLTIEKVEDTAHDIADNLDAFDASCHINRVGNVVEIALKYRVVNFNVNEFRQVSEREANINLSIENGVLCIRRPHTETVQEVTDIFMSSLSENLGEDVDVDTINMEGIVNPSSRTEFFERLVRSLEDLEHYDVTDVYIYHPKNIDDESEEDLGESDGESLDPVDTGVHIKKASLKGEKVLQSDELRGLYEKEFYIWKIVWQSKGKFHDSDIYEFEAQFSDPENFKGFSYLARGYYGYKGEMDYTVNRKRFTNREEKELGKKIEEAARRAIQDVVGEAGKEVEDGES